MRVRLEHWQLLLHLCQNNPELVTNKFNGVDGKTKGNALLQTVAERLNNLGFGEKTVEFWRKTLTDWECKTKAKAANVKRQLTKTGGGPSENPALSNLEERLLKVMGTKVVLGDEGVPELGFKNVQPPIGVSTPELTPSTSNVLLDHNYGNKSCQETTERKNEEINSFKKRN